MTNIYDTINQLERDIRGTDAYQSLAIAMDAVIADADALDLYRRFRKLQQALSLALQSGAEPSKEQMQEAQELQQQMQQNDLLADLMAQEQQLNRIIQDINDTVTKPIAEIYKKAE